MNSIILYKIEDVLHIPNLCDRYRTLAVKLSEKIRWYEQKQVINGVPYLLVPAYTNTLVEADLLMRELSSKADYIIYEPVNYCKCFPNTKCDSIGECGK